MGMVGPFPCVWEGYRPGDSGTVILVFERESVACLDLFLVFGRDTGRGIVGPLSLCLRGSHWHGWTFSLCVEGRDGHGYCFCKLYRSDGHGYLSHTQWLLGRDMVRPFPCMREGGRSMVSFSLVFGREREHGWTFSLCKGSNYIPERKGTDIVKSFLCVWEWAKGMLRPFPCVWEGENDMARSFPCVWEE